LDPACGSGAFPCGVMNEIIRRIDPDKQLPQQERYQKKLAIIQNVIYGVDIQPMAIQISNLRMFLSLIQEIVPDKRKENYGIEPLPNLETKFICANALIGLTKEKQGLLTPQSIKVAVEMLKNNRDQYVTASHPQDKKRLQEYDKKLRSSFAQLLETEAVFPRDTAVHLLQWNPYNQMEAADFFDSQWMFGITEGFDIVIGNPPYGAGLSIEEKFLFKNLFADVHTRTPDTFNYFISKGISLLKNNGVISYIVPNNLLFQGENTKTRNLLINTNHLQRVINLGDNTFEKADVPTCIFVAIKEKKEDYEVAYTNHRKGNIKTIDFNHVKDYLLKSDINKIPDLVIGVSCAGVKILKDIEAVSWKIDDVALEVASGIGTGGDKIFRISKRFAEENNFEKEILKPVLIGGEIDKYKIANTDHLLIYSYKKSQTDKLPNIFNYLIPFQEKLSKKRETQKGLIPWWCLHWHRYPELFSEEKIIMRQTADNIRATHDNNGFYTLNSILVFKINPDKNVSYRYAVILLNSKLNNFVYKNITQEEGRIFAEVKPQNVRKLFLPKISLKEQNIFEVLCDYLLFLNDENNQPINPRIGNAALAQFFQEIADACVVELIYGKEMKLKKVDILKYAREEIKPLKHSENKTQKAQKIANVHHAWSQAENEIYNRMKIISLMCPETAGMILSGCAASNQNYNV
ncbi:MAG: N-6 DNA methylase, partial [Planctomycetaceae bacterium]|nr:N-6 DNA methylase [Planctomycetaceae bacterium]